MTDNMAVCVGGAQLADREFRHFQHFIFEAAGIHLSPAKRNMVAGRLAKRLKALRISDYADYIRRLDADAEERRRAVDLLTTNETYFFREPAHFDALRAYLEAKDWRHGPIRLWSAACSSGEEVYSLAMLLDDVLGNRAWSVTGSDISSQVLAKARRGLYPMSRIELMPPDYLKRYCMKGTGAYAGSLLISRRLRERVSFKQINLNATLPRLSRFDAIFLRNVMIYFSSRTKAEVVRRLVDVLKPDGLFFVGHAESLTSFSSGLQMVRPSVYRKPA